MYDEEEDDDGGRIAGVANLDSGVGVYAPDAESYTLFKELFNPIIEDYHNGFGPDKKQPAVDLGQDKINQLPDLDPEGSAYRFLL